MEQEENLWFMSLCYHCVPIWKVLSAQAWRFSVICCLYFQQTYTAPFRSTGNVSLLSAITETPLPKALLRHQTQLGESLLHSLEHMWSCPVWLVLLKLPRFCRKWPNPAITVAQGSLTAVGECCRKTLSSLRENGQELLPKTCKPATGSLAITCYAILQSLLREQVSGHIIH